MARGGKKSIETQITEIETKKAQFQAKIESYKGKIADLDDAIKKLQESKKQKDLNSILHIIEKSGKSPDEVLAALNIEKK